MFAKVDVGLNELDNVIIDNYPAVRIYKAGVPDPIIQRSDFTDDGLYRWLEMVSNYGHELREHLNDDL